MAEYVRVASVGDIPDPGRQTIEVEDRVVALFHVGGSFFCIDDICTHDGGPLGDGQLDGYQVACPRHGARFDIRTGKPLTMPATKPILSHEVKVDGNEVYVRLSED